jgi:hypothetical protein
MSKMVYTRMFVKEIVRFRCPPPMVPNLACSVRARAWYSLFHVGWLLLVVVQDMDLGNGVIAPKGSLVMPSIWNASLQVRRCVCCVTTQ